MFLPLQATSPSPARRKRPKKAPHVRDLFVMGGTGLEPVTPSLSIRPLAYRPVPPVSVCFGESRGSARFRRLSSRSTTSDGRGLTASSGTAQALHPYPDQRALLGWQRLASEASGARART
jgi:hypothetical protein